MNGADDRNRETVRYRARFDECNPHGVVRPSGLLRWAQDCGWIHSERLGFTRGWYAERGLAWVVRCVDLHVLGDVAMGETVAVTTSVVGYRKVWARRQTQVVRLTGEPVGIALTDWVMTDARGMPTRVPPEFGQIIGEVPPFEPARVALPPPPPDAVVVRFAVRDHEIDPMAHVNNAVYLDWVEEAARSIGSERLRRFRMEFIAPVMRRTELTARAWRLDGGVGYRLTDEGDAERFKAVAT